ncbi:MAG TPA: valine--tRNA ligase [Planctomycetota bacterium]|nr:valine--tRNA ligase [Planctomycetota bacterium]
MTDFAPRFDPHEAESRLYKSWEERGLFTANAGSDKPPFTIVIPPPNVTGSLHMGHALNNTIQDLLIRWKRMEGYECLYLPGTDHAGIATQNVVEKELKKEGTNRHVLGRDSFLRRVWAWKERYGETIYMQLRRLGCSCDWSRERFTMDESYGRAIRTVFVHLFEKKLIYRGKRVINWCPRCMTALSDLEVRRPEGVQAGKLWHIRYPIAGEDGRHIVVATTRPETMLGDTAVMVHPKDPRYSGFVGRKVLLPFVNREIPVIADEAVDVKFGSGAVKVTPAHDMNDWEVSKRHGLPAVVVMDETAKMNDQAGPFAGLDRFEARKQVLERLKEMGLLEKEEEHATPVGHCERCDTVVEPYLSEQWFVKMKPLAPPAIEAVKSGRVKFHPERWARIYLDWMENIQDWCVSRQIWWGHRIPVWTCSSGHVIAAVDAPTECKQCGSGELKQDPDVLDTWFSSALWPFATLGWPEETRDLKRFYPTQTLVTDRGIINLWVARMIFMGLEFRGKEPFSDVIITATIMDDAGQRMSKSKGTGVDPLILMERYGADALRFALAMLSTGSQDFRFGKNLSVPRTEQARNFITKLWNACRYVATSVPEASPGLPPESEWKLEDRWIASRLNRTIQVVTESFKMYEFGRAASELYAFVWDDFCSWYLELTKKRLGEEVARRMLRHVIDASLRLLHPICPFVTEELSVRLGGVSLLRAPWPKPGPVDAPLESRMGAALEVVRGVREVKNRYGIAAAESLPAAVSFRSADLKNALAGEVEEIVRRLAAVSNVESGVNLERRPGAARWTGSEVTVYVGIAGKFDPAKEIARSEKEGAALESQVARSRTQLSNEAFRKAKPEMAAELESKLKEAESKLAELKSRVAELKELS